MRTSKLAKLGVHHVAGDAGPSYNLLEIAVLNTGWFHSMNQTAILALTVAL